MGMSYESPIKIIIKQIQDQIDDQIENCIFKAVQDVGIFVDKVELVRALRYDRHQYEKGYHDRDAEIVRCRDCKNAVVYDDNEVICTHIDSNGSDTHSIDWFCADGERRDEDV